MTPSLTVIILAWNGADYLAGCLKSVLEQGYEPLEVIVVDNASTDNSAAIAESFAPAVRLLRNAHNLGYAGGNNIGLAAANGEVLLLLNQDTVLQPGCLAALAATFAEPQVGLVGCKIYYPEGRLIQHAGALIRPGDAFALHRGQNEVDVGQYDTVVEADYLTGAALALHRRTLQRVGLLDEAYYPAYYEDADYCYRARRAGFQVLYQPQAVVRHHESASTAQRPYARTAALHRHRLRFVLSHWDEAGWQALAAAEQQATAGALWIDDAVARARAYLEALLLLPGLAARRKIDPNLGGPLAPGQQEWMAERLVDLRQQALDRIVGLISAAGPIRDFAPAPDGLVHSPILDGLGRLEALERRLARLRAEAVLREPPFTSTKRWLGPLIIGFRQLWNAIATRWYILPVLAQQTNVNQELAETLAEIVQEMELRVDYHNLAVADTLWRVLAADQASLARAAWAPNADSVGHTRPGANGKPVQQDQQESV